MSGNLGVEPATWGLQGLLAVPPLTALIASYSRRPTGFNCEAAPLFPDRSRMKDMISACPEAVQLLANDVFREIQMFSAADADNKAEVAFRPFHASVSYLDLTDNWVTDDQFSQIIDSFLGAARIRGVAFGPLFSGSLDAVGQLDRVWKKLVDARKGGNFPLEELDIRHASLQQLSQSTLPQENVREWNLRSFALSCKGGTQNSRAALASPFVGAVTHFTIQDDADITVAGLGDIADSALRAAHLSVPGALNAMLVEGPECQAHLNKIFEQNTALNLSFCFRYLDVMALQDIAAHGDFSKLRSLTVSEYSFAEPRHCDQLPLTCLSTLTLKNCKLSEQVELPFFQGLATLTKLEIEFKRDLRDLINNGLARDFGHGSYGEGPARLEHLIGAIPTMKPLITNERCREHLAQFVALVRREMQNKQWNEAFPYTLIVTKEGLSTHINGKQRQYTPFVDPVVVQ